MIADNRHPSGCQPSKKQEVVGNADIAVVTNHFGPGGAGVRKLAELLLRPVEEIRGAYGIELSDIAGQQIEIYIRHGRRGLPSSHGYLV